MTTTKKTATSTPADSVLSAGKETVEKMAKVGQETMQKNFDQVIEMSKGNIEKQTQSVMKSYDEANKLAQANYDAMNKSFGVFTKGFEDVSKAWAKFTQSSIDATVAYSKDAMAAKTVNELVDMNSTFTKAQFDAFVSESAKISEMTVKTTNEAIAPLKARVEKTVETFAKPMAA